MVYLSVNVIFIYIPIWKLNGEKNCDFKYHVTVVLNPYLPIFINKSSPEAPQFSNSNIRALVVTIAAQVATLIKYGIKKVAALTRYDTTVRK